MAREIGPVCDFIFASICTSLPMNTVDVELTTRMVKDIYTYRKDHMAESMVFSPWSRTVIPFPSLWSKIQPFQDESRQAMTWNNNNPMPQSSAPSKPKCNPRKCAPGKTRTRWSNQKHRFNPIKTDRFNTHNIKPNDMNKIDVIDSSPKRLCTKSLESCTYWKYDSPHPSPVPSDWSSEDWDGDKARNREQKSFADTLLDKETQDRTQEKQKKHLISNLENLMLKQDKTTPIMTDKLIPPLETLDEEQESEGKEVINNVMAYSMTGQELKLQHKEEKYSFYMNTFGYKGDTDLDPMAYPYLD